MNFILSLTTYRLLAFTALLSVIRNSREAGKKVVAVVEVVSMIFIFGEAMSYYLRALRNAYGDSIIFFISIFGFERPFTQLIASSSKLNVLNLTPCSLLLPSF